MEKKEKLAFIEHVWYIRYMLNRVLCVLFLLIGILHLLYEFPDLYFHNYYYVSVSEISDVQGCCH